MTVGLTTEQIDHICYQIGEWYLEWENKMWSDGKPNQHWLGRAKEELKTMICGEKYTDNSETLKTEIEKRDEIIQFLENFPLILGITYGAISKILQSPDEELRGKLTDLFENLSKEVSALYQKSTEQ
jgi:hypothetical protein